MASDPAIQPDKPRPKYSQQSISPIQWIVLFLGALGGAVPAFYIFLLQWFEGPPIPWMILLLSLVSSLLSMSALCAFFAALFCALWRSHAGEKLLYCLMGTSVGCALGMSLSIWTKPNLEKTKSIVLIRDGALFILGGGTIGLVSGRLLHGCLRRLKN